MHLSCGSFNEIQILELETENEKSRKVMFRDWDLLVYPTFIHPDTLYRMYLMTFQYKPSHRNVSYKQ